MDMSLQIPYPRSPESSRLDYGQGTEGSSSELYPSRFTIENMEPETIDPSILAGKTTSVITYHDCENHTRDNEAFGR